MVKVMCAEISKKWSLTLLWVFEYVDTCMHVFMVVVSADCLQRFWLALREYIVKPHYYLPEDRMSILRRAFTYKDSTQKLFLLLVLVVLCRFGATGRLPLPPATFFAFMPLYWVYNMADVGYSTLNYAYWIRDSHGLDYATGMASNYFHGYIKLALPPSNNTNGLRTRMKMYEAKHNATFGLDRLIILIPDEMFLNDFESDILEKADPLETVHINRAGVYRPFEHAVYRLTKPINGTYYYFVLEGATPMLSYYNALNSTISATWQMKAMKREIWMKFCKHLKELVQAWPETRNMVKLVMYKSQKPNGEPMDVGELIIENMKHSLH